MPLGPHQRVPGYQPGVATPTTSSAQPVLPMTNFPSQNVSPSARVSLNARAEPFESATVSRDTSAHKHATSTADHTKDISQLLSSLDMTGEVPQVPASSKLATSPDKAAQKYVHPHARPSPVSPTKTVGFGQDSAMPSNAPNLPLRQILVLIEHLSDSDLGLLPDFITEKQRARRAVLSLRSSKPVQLSSFTLHRNPASSVSAIPIGSVTNAETAVQVFRQIYRATEIRYELEDTESVAKLIQISTDFSQALLDHDPQGFKVLRTNIYADLPRPDHPMNQKRDESVQAVLWAAKQTERIQGGGIVLLLATATAQGALASCLRSMVGIDDVAQDEMA